MSNKRKLFEKKEGFCDLCKEKLTKNKGKYVKRYYFENKVCCFSCYARNFKVLSKEEKEEQKRLCKELRIEREKAKRYYYKERTKYLKSLDPNELLSIINSNY